MSIDFSQKERAFVGGLAADTGRDLDGWMAAIAGAGLSHRNEIIDWLRQNGFTFARASWIERIHHNGGRLIYADGERTPAEAHKRKAAKPASALAPVEVQASAHIAPAKVSSAKSDDEIDGLLAAGKAYRPLAQAVLRDILSTVPGADARALSGHIVTSHVRPFAALLAGAKDVRLMLSFGARTPATGWSRTKPQPGLDSLAALSHMLVLTDARQLTQDLKDLIAASARDTAD